MVLKRCFLKEYKQKQYPDFFQKRRLLPDGQEPQYVLRLLRLINPEAGKRWNGLY